MEVMFSEGSVSHSVHRGGLPSGGGRSVSRGVCLWEGGLLPGGLAPGEVGTQPVLTSSGGHCSSRYASYWNAFLFDIFVLAGQTWVMTIMHLIQHAKDLEEGKDYNILDLYMKVPFLELQRSSGQYWSDIARTMESPRVMRTHLPHQIWKDNIDKHPNVKIIQTIRNPKDTLVSYYHHFRSDAMIGRFNGSWDQFCQS